MLQVTRKRISFRENLPLPRDELESRAVIHASGLRGRSFNPSLGPALPCATHCTQTPGPGAERGPTSHRNRSSRGSAARSQGSPSPLRRGRAAASSRSWDEVAASQRDEPRDEASPQRAGAGREGTVAPPARRQRSGRQGLSINTHSLISVRPPAEQIDSISSEENEINSRLNSAPLPSTQGPPPGLPPGAGRTGTRLKDTLQGCSVLFRAAFRPVPTGSVQRERAEPAPARSDTGRESGRPPAMPVVGAQGLALPGTLGLRGAVPPAAITPRARARLPSPRALEISAPTRRQ